MAKLVTRKNRSNRKARKQSGGEKLELNFYEPLVFDRPEEEYGPGYNNDDNYVQRLHKGTGYHLIYPVKDGEGRTLYWQDVKFGAEQMAALKALSNLHGKPR